MSVIPTLPGVHSTFVDTPRLRQHVLTSGPENGVPVLFIHGNASSAAFWEEVMTKLPAGYRAIAPDLRGYGETEDKLIDATRGFGDWIDDLLALKAALKINRYHIAGHSLGGAIAMWLIAADANHIRSATLVAPGSPYGFGGTKGLDGKPCNPDFAGSGGGIVNAAFTQRMAKGDRSLDDPQSAPRVVMNSFYFKPPFKAWREEDLLSSMLSEKIGPDKYPGDLTPSPNWPHVAPGGKGPANALSPKYLGDSVQRFITCAPKPPILWVRGSHDQIVADMSLFCLGTLGKLGVVPGWPGDDAYPPQPMVGQTRAVLEQYASHGGAFNEVIMTDTGHSPFIEQPDAFMKHFLARLA